VGSASVASNGLPAVSERLERSRPPFRQKQEEMDEVLPTEAEALEGFGASTGDPR